MTEPLCTCGKRPKHKCCEESGVGGKMCLRPLFDIPEGYVFKRMETFTPNEWVKEWVKNEVKKSGEYFTEEIYK